ncbi:hypothetical protein Micbo1qcDRAFT_159357 [Microdochium bolleyi]|uniref:Uncharacterized protein n=1 Tax=Microdochium bolleyi TaxID=196109 RepID=A0A136JAS6_9PEZI|nr:hypothetical protein Micbo1qcDRAFT_159357 [Microdochium bolleyi]
MFVADAAAPRILCHRNFVSTAMDQEVLAARNNNPERLTNVSACSRPSRHHGEMGIRRHNQHYQQCWQAWLGEAMLGCCISQ